MAYTKAEMWGVGILCLITATSIVLMSLALTNKLGTTGSGSNCCCYAYQYLYTSANPTDNLVFTGREVAAPDDKGVVNGLTVLTLGYVDTRRCSPGDTITWDLSATATTSADNNQLCIGATIVHKDSFFGTLNGKDTGFNWGDNETFVWLPGVFSHSFYGPPTVANCPMLKIMKIIKSEGVFFLGNKSDTVNLNNTFAGAPEGDKSTACTKLKNTPVSVKLGTTSAVIPDQNGIGPSAYLAILWFTHTTVDPMQIHVANDTIKFTPKCN